MRSLGRTKRTEVRIYIIIIYYIYTCICSRIYMFFSSSFCFFCFGIAIVYCDVGCLYCFLVPFLACGIFVCRLCLPQKKTCATCGKKNTKHAHELQDCPPRHLLTFDSGLSLFPSLFLHVLNWVHVSWVLFTTERTMNHMTTNKNTTFRMEIPD